MNEMDVLAQNSYLFGSNAPYIEELYDHYLAQPQSVPETWRVFFDQLVASSGAAKDVAHAPIVEALTDWKPRLPVVAAAAQSAYAMVSSYRRFGHFWAKLDPLARFPTPEVPELSAFETSDRAVYTSDLPVGQTAPLSHEALRTLLHTIYCGHIGFECDHLVAAAERKWLYQRIEVWGSLPPLTAEKKKHILGRLMASEVLELYLAKRYVGVKRFGLDGAEALVVAMDEIIHKSGERGIGEVVIGMAHRGRLNLLVNVVGKSPAELFAEFDGREDSRLLSGDVKYHQGFSSDLSTPFGSVHATLAYNPSHLEIVNPVVMGSVRARQEKRNDHQGDYVLPVLIHGDAAVSGQGVVQECLNLSQTTGFKIGGTIHIIVNNQIGFTTSAREDLRSTYYCSDVAKGFDMPVFHVNGDDPEAVAFVTQLAVDYRCQFHKDVFVDIVCYRRFGHNEQDDPFVTQPYTYQLIAKQASVFRLYAQQLCAQGLLTDEELQTLVDDYRQSLDEGRHMYNPVVTAPDRPFAVDWSPFMNQPYTDVADSAVTEPVVRELGEMLTAFPKDFTLLRSVERVISDRRAMYSGEKLLDWGAAENLAYASLLKGGFSIRVSGEDVGRGTFAHRHATFYKTGFPEWQKPESTVVPLARIAEHNGTRFDIFNTALSEEGVLGFEYGYASALPYTLVVWEAQFGDFANGAQVLFDQFIFPAEAKWGRMCGLVCLLPHGYEGQGAEHTSARFERYLQLCAERNAEVCMPSNAAQIFHLLRRQMLRKQRKPLIVMTPKSLLRKIEASSPLSAITSGCFQTVIGDHVVANPDRVKRIIVCTGKVYYDLRAFCQQDKREDIAILRIEQLYPFPEAALLAEAARYPHCTELVWCQEEPQNMGAWYQIRHHLESCWHNKVFFAGRAVSSSPAPAYMSKHLLQQKRLVEEAFGPFSVAKTVE